MLVIDNAMHIFLKYIFEYKRGCDKQHQVYSNNFIFILFRHLLESIQVHDLTA